MTGDIIDLNDHRAGRAPRDFMRFTHTVTIDECTRLAEAVRRFFMLNASVPRMEFARCSFGGWTCFDGDDSECIVHVDLPPNAFVPFLRFIAAEGHIELAEAV